MDNNNIMYEEEGYGASLYKKAKGNPFFPIAVGACLATCGYGAYLFKRKGKMSTSVFLMQLRVAAQGMAVGTLTVGMLYKMVQQNYLTEEKKE